MLINGTFPLPSDFGLSHSWEQSLEILNTWVLPNLCRTCYGHSPFLGRASRQFLAHDGSLHCHMTLPTHLQLIGDCWTQYSIPPAVARPGAYRILPWRHPPHRGNGHLLVSEILSFFKLLLLLFLNRSYSDIGSWFQEQESKNIS